MRNGNHLVVVLMLAATACSLMVCGCSDSKARQGNDSVMQAIDLARLACDNAASLLGTTPYQYDKKYMALLAPLSAAATQGGVTLPQSGEVNPRALEVLEHADEQLAKAIGESSGVASRSVVELGNETLGHVKMLKGAYYLRKGAAAGDKLQAAQGTTLAALFDLGLNKKLLDNYNQAISAGDKAVGTLLDAAKKDFVDQSALIGDLDGQIEKLVQTKESLSKANETLSAEARSLVMEYKAATGKASQEKFEQAQAKEAQVSDNASKIRDAEQKIEDLKGDKRPLELKKAGARRTQEALEQASKGGKDSRDALTAPRDAVQQAVTKGQAALKTAVEKDLTEAYQLWSKQEEKAIKCHTEAAKEFQAARGGEHEPVTGATAGLAGDEAYALLARANDQGEMASTIASLEALLKHVKVEDPSLVEKLTLASSKTYIDAAMHDYADAAEKYNSASVAMANPQMKWTYDGLRADALLNRYRFSGDINDRKTATELLAACAAQAKPYEDSAAVAGLVRLQKSVPSPASQPATGSPSQ